MPDLDTVIAVIVAMITTTIICVVLGLAGWGIWYEIHHPCLKYSSRRVYVEETTTYIATDGGIPMGPMTSKGGISVPITTPAHYETIQICEERK